QFKDEFWLHRREEKGIWKGLYQPFLIETNREMDSEELVKTEAFQSLNLTNIPLLESSNKQRLTHQLIHSKLFSIKCSRMPETPDTGLWTAIDTMTKLPLPKTILNLFEKKSTFKEIAQHGNF
ncbi:MAG: NUDIX domain-containing protein, partial [Chitinophagaceae bacterium]